MIHLHKKIQTVIICSMIMILANNALKAQVTQPNWWFGISGAANFNWYDGTTQRLNGSLIVPAAFHKGFGVRPYGSVLVEYRPAGMWGGALNVGYDGRGGKFKEVVAPCNCPADLTTNTSYVTVEPSLRLSVPKTNLYFFAGPRVAFSLTNDFTYTQLKQPTTNAQLSDMHKTIISGQVGVGYEIPLSPAASLTKVNLSPFVSYQPYFGEEPRDIESWSITTVRAGIALKFGRGSKLPVKDITAPPVPEISFTVRAPKTVPLQRQVSETLPLRSSIFFDDGSAEIPGRYIMLSNTQAGNFKEEQLQKQQSDNTTGRSSRQLNVYHNILNILGDRLRANPGTTISLSGASGKGIADGTALAISVKQYIVNTFAIDGSRIATEGRIKPLIPSEQPGGSKELVLLRAGDRRVDVTSTSPQLLMEVGGGLMKPVQIEATQVDPLDSRVVLNVDKAKELFKSWSVDLTDERGVVQHYGPFTNNQESISGAAILGTNPEGNYKVVMVGQTKNGLTITKENSVHLAGVNEAVEKGLRFSILFDFDRANSTAAYTKFLSNTVASSITDGATVIIHGHTDIIGEEDHNLKLSQERAREVQSILERALAKAGKNSVKFETIGFGEDVSHSPFDNNLPEERFYNRTVIIDIIPVK
ncbi:OmpA family protein [Mucilaginibacter paludis]|uniref:OmpA/MotB domain protein n=1 Tax=Mucilaginibacter paludis DSM 18603 TaxID=714943 RepID=H1YBF5_9SPHI|nr:OmpA family protein [Mucilaginibacter paludis]EHQ31209.1 OmpA/MotB domain protein [Mucilaginibacter paludis DSM 18603]